MARPANPFDPRMVLAVIAVGALALLVLLYAIGAGLDGRRDSDGAAHAASDGLTGYTALSDLLEKRGFSVDLSRGQGRMDDAALLILTPLHYTDADDLAEVLDNRRYVGPTLVILPKWNAIPASMLRLREVKGGWVVLAGSDTPEWLGDMAGFEGTVVEQGKSARWGGFGLSGAMPEPETVQSLDGSQFIPLVESGDRMLAAYYHDDGYYPVLEDAAGVAPTNPDADSIDTDKWGVVVVAEPDLLNNYGMASEQRARAAVALIEASMEGEDLPIVFDMTMPGHGRSENLLTLAFEPPFLAATLCLLLAALVVGWRAFRRFGPPVTADGAPALGKRQLAANGAGLVIRARRWRLIGPPYADLLAARIAARLRLRPGDDAALDAALERRGMAADYHFHITNLRRASSPAELLRAAGGLRSIERNIPA